MVAGVVALMLEANPELGWRDVKHILAETAKKVDTDFKAVALNAVNYVGWVENFAEFNHHPWYGFGAVDAAAAVTAAKNHTNLVASMTTVFNTTSDFDQSISDFANPTQPYIDSIMESGDGIIEHVRVRIQFNHPQPNQLGFRLTSPSGTTATLLAPFSQKGGLGTPSITQPSEFASNAFYGEGKAGFWQLLVTDHITGDTATIRNFGISFMYR
jgi:subtilisin-like proprotein convertase family protein